MSERAFQRAYGLLDELRTVVEGHHRDFRHTAVLEFFLGHGGLHLLDFVLHVVDDFKWIAPFAGHDHAAHGFLSFLIKSSATVAWPKAHACQILHSDGHSFSAGHWSILQIGKFFHIAQSADDVFGLVDFHCSCSHVDVGVFHGLHHLHEIDAIGAHGLRIKVHLIFLHEAAHAGHLAHAFCRRELIAHVVVLQSAQFLGIPAACGTTDLCVAAFKRIPEYLSQGCSIGSELRFYAIGQQSTWQRIEFLQYARPAPVEIHTFVEDDIDERHAHHGGGADGLHARDTHQGCGKRIGHLVLHILGRAPHPLSRDDLLIVADIGYSIYCNWIARNESCMPVERCRGESI